MSLNTSRPIVGQSITVYGVLCRIVRVYPFGTLDAVAVNGGKAYRVTGLSYL